MCDGADVARLDAHAHARHRVLDLEPCQRQRLVVGDLDRERHVLAEERAGLTEAALVAEADQAVALPERETPAISIRMSETMNSSGSRSSKLAIRMPPTR